MTKILVKCRNIHIGDILFASSVAKKLKEENEQCIVDFDIDYLQPLELLKLNPYINEVYFKDSKKNYDKVFNLIETDYVIDPYESAPRQFQRLCNIKKLDDTFEIYNNSMLDYSIQKSMDELVKLEEWSADIIKVGYQMDWNKKSFLFTEDQYYAAEGGEDGSGYGSGNRSTWDIIKCLEAHPNILLFALGLDENTHKRYPAINTTSRFSFTASLIKNCDYVIGSEGCLTNISSALETKTIITTDYIYQMFGPTGIKWLKEGGDKNNLETRIPFLGPLKFFPHGNHVHLNPFLTDEQVGQEILNIILNGK